ncbi:glycosyltransferase family 4 protein [Rhodoferax sp.]|uniref:glycosyltransferase family 4 protein n=1 Tax=Rhodoferax sp. TaxID=50421 RepID=UPI0026196324|nr:glycosyltransferase family 4 protein [Rhodoferax sp.]MDD2926175.1 glycosyltransferase family 4 protein [Rhodoferax sp.]
MKQSGQQEPARRLRIAVLNRQFSATGGGAERYSMALVAQLAAQHEIHVFAQHIDHDVPGVSYHRVSKLVSRPRWLNQLWYAGVTWWATRRGFDVVHSHENTWHGQVQTVHVLPIKYNLFQGRQGWAYGLRWLKVLTSPRLLVYLALERSRFALRRPRTIVLTSQTLVAQTLQAYPACHHAIEVITPGVDRVYGTADRTEQVAARQALGVPLVGQCILFVGNDYRKKGLGVLIHALAALPDSFLVVVGNPAQVPVFRAQAEAAGVAARVFFLGALRDVGPAYVAADCLAHPTQEDTFAMVVLEAMAHGLPVVVSAQPYCGIAALLQPGRDALLLDNPHDVQALVAALQQCRHDLGLAERLRTGALAFAGAHLWAAQARRQAQIYQQMADAG